MAQGTRKNFVFQAGDRDRLERLKQATQLATETDVIRTALALLEGFLHDGLASASMPMADGRRLITIPFAPGRTITLAERKNGSFYAGAWMCELDTGVRPGAPTSDAGDQ